MAVFLGCVFLPLPTVAQTPPPGLPEGAGKTLVEGVCTGCHQTSLISRSSGYTREGWGELIATMIDLSRTAEEKAVMTDYLAANFPPNTKRAPKLVSGATEITFKEWQTPTLGQRTRDPIQAPDGSIWWAGQFGNMIGRLDLASGQMREYPLPAKANPHSVTLDAAGMPWYTGNRNGTIGKVDPASGQITVYKMPDPAARDPHTAEFDKHGILWFTLQQSDMFGRLDPKTGDIKLVSAPRPGVKPYGLKIDAEGNPWFSCNGSNCLVKVNPATMEMTEFKLIPGSTVRRLDIADDGMIWYVNSSLGRLGRLDPKTGETMEWPSPSGPRSHPYAILVVDGIVWYNESAMRPDALVRFDPKTERFQSWAIPSGGVHAGHIRHMRSTREGSLLIHQSSTNRMIEVQVKPNAAIR